MPLQLLFILSCSKMINIDSMSYILNLQMSNSSVADDIVFCFLSVGNAITNMTEKWQIKAPQFFY